MSGPEFLKMLGADAGEHDPNTEYLYVQIPDPVIPIERTRKYAEPIEEVLSATSLGTVIGGGSMLKADYSIEYVGLDVTVYDLDKALPVLAAKLREIGAPKGTVIHYGDDESKRYDIWERQ